MSNKAKVTCISSVYNKEAWIGETLITYLQQTLQEWEAVIVNDGSTDSTGLVLDHYAKKDPRFKVIHQAENKGCSVSLNLASSLATSDILVVCSGDDLYEKDRFFRAWKYFKKHKDIDVYYESYFLGHADATTKAEHLVVPFNLDEYLTILPNGRANQTVSHGFSAYRKQVYDKVKYDETRKVGIDYPFFADVAKAGFQFGCEATVKGGIYRILPKSVTPTFHAEINAEDRAYVA